MSKHRVLHDPLFKREVVPGSPAEYEVVEALKNIFSEISDWVKIVDVPCDTWVEEECLIQVGGLTVKCHALPYTSSAVVEGKLYVFKDLKSVEKTMCVEDQCIAILEFPEEVKLAKYIVLELYRRGFEAVIFYDRVFKSFRRTVVTGSKNYYFQKGSPPPIPAVSVKREDYISIVKTLNTSPRKALINVKTRNIHSVLGKNVLAGINGDGEKEIHVSVHHDHWFTGFSDNLVGVEALIRIAELLKNRNSLHNIVFISYTAKEVGAPYYISWYWSWGSRYYLETVNKADKIDQVIANINIDAIYKHPLEVYGNPALQSCIARFIDGDKVGYKGYDSMDFDSFSYTVHGVPALTITTMNSMNKIYHSTLDNGSDFNYKTLDETVELAVKLIHCIQREQPRYVYILNRIKENIGENIPLETRVLVSKLENLVNKSDEEKLVRLITKYFTYVAYIPSLRLYRRTDILGNIASLLEIRNSIRDYVGETIELKTLEKDLAQLAPSSMNIDELVEAINYYIALESRETERKLNSIVASLLR